jgi:hypothetical protein
MDAWELNPELGSLWLKASATLGGGGGITSPEGLHDWVQVGHAPFNLYPGTEEKHGKSQSR